MDGSIDDKSHHLLSFCMGFRYKMASLMIAERQL